MPQLTKAGEEVALGQGAVDAREDAHVSLGAVYLGVLLLGHPEKQPVVRDLRAVGLQRLGFEGHEL